MSILDRVILTLYTVLIMIISASVILFAVGFYSADLVISHLSELTGSWEIILCAAIIFLLSIKLLYTGVTREGPKDIVVRINDDGVVRVSVRAIRKFVETNATQVRGIHDVKASLTVSDDLLKIKLVAGVLPEANIPELSGILQKKVQESVKETIGREVSDVSIVFNTISYEAKNKERFE